MGDLRDTGSKFRTNTFSFTTNKMTQTLIFITV